MRPITYPPYPPKPTTEDPKYRHHAAIESTVKSSDLADRALDAKITLSTRELFAVSPDVRKHVRDLVTSKRITVHTAETTEETNTPIDPSPDEPASAFLNLGKYEDPATAVPSLPLRVIFPNFGQGVQPECILDGGAQMVIMHSDVWEKLRVPLATGGAMSMQSANSTTTMTRGIIENHPVQLGPVTIHLQIQVVDTAPFDVLLGRPFFDITSCMEMSTAGGGHHIRIKDPTTGETYDFPTEPRGRNRPPRDREGPNQGPGANFRR
jgi:hypothetical protein